MWILVFLLASASYATRVEVKTIPNVPQNKRHLVQEQLVVTPAGTYSDFDNYMITMEVGTNNQPLNFLLDFNYGRETTVILSGNTGNCTGQTNFDPVGGGVTPATASTYTLGSSWMYFLMTPLATTEGYTFTSTIKFAGMTLTHQFKGLTKFDCTYDYNGQTDLPYDGLVSFVPNNTGSLTGFTAALNSTS